MIAYNNKDFGISLSTNYFWSGKTSQRTGALMARIGKFSLSYENDGYPFHKLGMGDGGDSYRTAAITLGWEDVSIGMRIFTGYRDMKKDIAPENSPPGYPHGIVGNPEASEYLSSPLFLGYKGSRIGINHYNVGHAFQNVLAHTWLKPQARFPWRGSSNSPSSFYGGYYNNANPFTNW